MSKRGTARFVLALIGTNLKATFAHRAAFWLQMILMGINNVIFFAIWWILFQNLKEIRGWRIEDLLALYGTAAIAFGLFVVLGGGTRDLARTITEGDLDSYLTQPKPPLLQAASSRSYASGWGDVASGLLLVSLSGYITWTSLLWIGVVAGCGAAVFISTAIIAHSMAFWAGSVNSAARQYSDFMVMFSVYPEPIFTGWLKVILFTLIPAGFVSYLPVGLYRDFNLLSLLSVVGGAAAFTGLAILVFHRGLRRYESGNRIRVQG